MSTSTDKTNRYITTVPITAACGMSWLRKLNASTTTRLGSRISPDAEAGVDVVAHQGFLRGGVPQAHGSHPLRAALAVGHHLGLLLRQCLVDAAVGGRPRPPSAWAWGGSCAQRSPDRTRRAPASRARVAAAAETGPRVPFAGSWTRARVRPGWGSDPHGLRVSLGIETTRTPGPPAAFRRRYGGHLRRGPRPGSRSL